MNTSSFRALSAMAGAVLLVAASGAMAERADNSKPMQIAADAMRYDDVKQTSVWTGNVIATKGTIVIRGDVVEVRYTGGPPLAFNQNGDWSMPWSDWVKGSALRPKDTPPPPPPAPTAETLTAPGP